jgi:basic membrane protein A
VRWDYTGFFDRPDLGRESTFTMLDAGADVIFQAAGETGLGVLDAVAERGTPNTLPFAIGVDANQDWIKPGQVIVSMRKRVDIGTYTAVKHVSEGTFEGGILSLGIFTPIGGISISDMEDLDILLSDPVVGADIETETGMSVSEVRDAVAAMRETWATVDGYNVWDIAEELTQKLLTGEIVVPVPFTADDIAFYRERYG